MRLDPIPGAVYIWGGYGPHAAKPEPTPRCVLPSRGNKKVTLATGRHHGAISDGEHVWTVGYGGDGCLGLGSTADAHQVTAVASSALTSHHTAPPDAHRQASARRCRRLLGGLVRMIRCIASSRTVADSQCAGAYDGPVVSALSRRRGTCVTVTQSHGDILHGYILAWGHPRMGTYSRGYILAWVHPRMGTYSHGYTLAWVHTRMGTSCLLAWEPFVLGSRWDVCSAGGHCRYSVRALQHRRHHRRRQIVCVRAERLRPARRLQAKACHFPR